VEKGKRKYPNSLHYDTTAGLWLCSVRRCSFLDLGEDGFEYFAWEGKQDRVCVRRIESEARESG